MKCLSPSARHQNRLSSRPRLGFRGRRSLQSYCSHWVSLSLSVVELFGFFFDKTSNSDLLCEILPLIIFLVDGILKPIVAIVLPYGRAFEYVEYGKILTILGIKP